MRAHARMHAHSFSHSAPARPTFMHDLMSSSTLTDMSALQSTFSYEASIGALEIRTVFSAELFVRDPDFMVPSDSKTAAHFVVSPPDGVAFPPSMYSADGSIKDDRDASASKPSPAGYALYQQLRRTPVDPAMQYLNLSSRCTLDRVTTVLGLDDAFHLEANAKEGGVLQLMRTLQQAAPHFQVPKMTPGQSAAQYMALMKMAGVRAAITAAVPCGITFTRQSALSTRRSYFDIKVWLNGISPLYDGLLCV